MAELVYLLCAVTSFFCAALLFRSHRRQRTRLLMWSTLCFVFFAINNVMLFVDLVVVPDAIDLAVVRSASGLVGALLLLYGLLWEDA